MPSGIEAFRAGLAAQVAGGAPLAAGHGFRGAVLVEGLSDLAAVEALAAREGRDLPAEGIAVVPMGGAMSIAAYAEALGPHGLGLRLTGLCDANEEPVYVRGFERAEVHDPSLHVCVADLEDELLRALGTDRAEEVVAAAGEERRWQTFRRQPAQLGRSRHDQLRRFLGTASGRKIRYGTLLTEALAADRVPAPLTALLAGL
ncbi:TOPRIM nucleotidyl transferase/hydrolase domain-containing protein [Streptomyces sp. CA-253872]|uniref:TOPRIM nucleotidyl transferase/hydrolase domain-containing protein n=1 Tax=Streptomyces sp. CA-253872 TaxID=3240067 RepID=UPI003D9409A8